ncbi:MAG: ATP-binding cassette domain-containing protein [Deltaproteobacteria bacterium]|nr:ATP-binding cassette domain-containing protein [Deltaproteobacteria bacterium]
MHHIEIENLSKHFKVFARREGVLGSLQDLFHRDYSTLKAVDDISLKISPGEVVGYIGANGAGKSTSIKMMTGILNPSSGSMNILGFDPARQRKEYTRHIGVVFGQRTQLWWDIAVVESFKLLAKIYGVQEQEYKQRLDILIEILGLKDLLRTPVRKLSLGQRMRCDLAASLLHQPKVLFLDEPTIGLDAVAKHNVRAFLRKVNEDFGTTIILTTHDMAEIEELCERIVIIDHGKIIYDGALNDIKSLPGTGRRLSIDLAQDPPVDELNRIFKDKAAFQPEGERRVVSNFDPHLVSSLDLLQEITSRYQVVDFSVSEPSIEEVVMKIYQGGVKTA